MPKRNLTKRRYLRGGAWYNPNSWFSNDSSNVSIGPKRTWGQWWTNTTSNAESSLSGAVSSINPFANKEQPVTITPTPLPLQQQPLQQQQQPMPEEPQKLGPVGGYKRTGYKRTGYKRIILNKKTRKNKNMKKGGSTSIAYYAAPYSNPNDAKPTYWIKGGKIKTKKSHSRHK
jgi:hypothetical protein